MTSHSCQNVDSKVAATSRNENSETSWNTKPTPSRKFTIPLPWTTSRKLISINLVCFHFILRNDASIFFLFFFSVCDPSSVSTQIIISFSITIWHEAYYGGKKMLEALKIDIDVQNVFQSATRKASVLIYCSSQFSALKTFHWTLIFFEIKKIFYSSCYLVLSGIWSFTASALENRHS